MTPWLAICALATAMDGDTIQCGRDRIRLRNVNAVELHQPGGPEAKHALAALVAGQAVRCRVFATDKFGRLVGECGTDATPSLDDALIAGGHGRRR